MASKTYIVVKNGEEIEKLKTLTAAKELADAEGAEVLCGGKCVYQGKDVSSEVTGETAAEDTAAGDTAEAPASDVPEEAAKDGADETEQVIIKTEPVIAKKPTQPETKPVETTRYRLTMLMNIRRKPSLDSHIVSVKPAGTVVRAVGIEGDWLHLADGSYVLYKNGEYAKKVEE